MKQMEGLTSMTASFRTLPSGPSAEMVDTSARHLGKCHPALLLCTNAPAPLFWGTNPESHIPNIGCIWEEF